MIIRKDTPSAARDLATLAWRQPLWAVPFALFFGTLFGGRLSEYVLCYKMSLVFAYSIALGLWAVQHFIAPRLACPPGEGEAWRTGAWYVGASLVASYVAAFLIHFTLLPGFMGSARNVAISGMFTLLFSALFTGVNYAIVFYRQSVERARAVEAMRAELAEAELRALRAQINPHFLFNTLNSIASLIALNPAAAEETTTRLAEVFRYALRASERERVPLGEELAFLSAYLEIERTRFGARLKVEERIEPGLESLEVPSLLLQPVVENAVRYAVSPRPEGGRITITAARRPDRLEIEVMDDGPGMNGAPATGALPGEGFGLSSVRERLRAAGPPHAIDIQTEPGRGTLVRITLPLVPSSSSSRP